MAIARLRSSISVQERTYNPFLLVEKAVRVGSPDIDLNLSSDLVTPPLISWPWKSKRTGRATDFNLSRLASRPERHAETQLRPRLRDLSSPALGNWPESNDSEDVFVPSAIVWYWLATGQERARREAGGGRKLGSLGKLAKKVLGKEKGRGQTSAAAAAAAAAAARQTQYPCHGREKRRTASEKEKRSEYASSLLLRHSFCAASPLTIAKTNPT
jgi:hypothetical protein